MTTLLGPLGTESALAAVNNSDIEGPFRDSPAATKTCLECHEDAAKVVCWKAFDWHKASVAGMKASGLDYSGEFDLAPTKRYWHINHMVSPKEDALKCLDCHGDNGRMDWAGLGYKGDPLTGK